MGIVFGKVAVETPKYSVTAKGTDFEIREYQTWLIAETCYEKGKEGEGFRILAGYIGALGKPQNVKARVEEGEEGERVAMTAPVITYLNEGKEEGKAGEEIGMTAPVIITEDKAGEGKKLVTMQFILPSKYSLATVPKPTDKRVALREISGRKFGVIRFSGIADDALVEKKRERLRNGLQEAGYSVTGEHILARYNPPFTLSFLRTNEVFLPVA